MARVLCADNVGSTHNGGLVVTTFIELLAEASPPIRNTDVAKGTGLSESRVFQILSGSRAIRSRSTLRKPTELALFSVFFDKTPDQIIQISHASVARRLQESQEDQR